MKNDLLFLFKMMRYFDIVFIVEKSHKIKITFVPLMFPIENTLLEEVGH